MRYFKAADLVARRKAPRDRWSSWALLALMALATSARAAEPARVLLVAPPDASSLVSEALVRAQGELFAVGLASARTATVPTDSELSESSTEPPHLPTDVYGLLVLEQRDGSVIIHAWAPHSTSSLDAQVDLSAPGMTAEVLAVKAVETLRAAMLQFARHERGAVPEAVRGFTKLPSESEPAQTPPAKPAPKPAPKPRRDETEPEPGTPPSGVDRGPAPSASLGRGLLGAWLGPQIAVEPRGGGSLGGQVGLLAGRRWGFVAVMFDTSFGKLELDASEGDAKVQRRAVALQLGARLPLSRVWEAFARGGAGYASFDVRGTGAAGYRGLHLTHGSLTLQANVGVVYWLAGSLGVYSNLGTVLALDAPSVLIAGRPVATLDQPSLFLSLGATAVLF